MSKVILNVGTCPDCGSENTFFRRQVVDANGDRCICGCGDCDFLWAVMTANIRHLNPVPPKMDGDLRAISIFTFLMTCERPFQGTKDITRHVGGEDDILDFDIVLGEVSVILHRLDEQGHVYHMRLKDDIHLWMLKSRDVLFLKPINAKAMKNDNPAI